VTVPIVSVADLRQRCEFHAQALYQACREYYTGFDVKLIGNKHSPDELREGFLPATWLVTASMPRASEFSAEIEGLLQRFGR
jgi:hypothetical protein